MGTCEPTRETETRPPIVVYCLHKGCRQTTWYGLNNWQVSMERIDGINSGKFASMMAPYCPKHRQQRRNPAA